MSETEKREQATSYKPQAKRLMTGNEAIGEAAVQAGCLFYAGYPITPQNELTAYMAKRMTEEGRTFIQSESELAAINMVFGASITGTRAMTSSSSPGISLKQEGISYLAACRLPAVVVNVMRGGPGLGNIAPSQADYFQATKGGGHGDYHMIVLAPASVQEAFDLTMLSFDLADLYRTPVMVLADGMLGQMMEGMRVHSSQLPSGRLCFASHSTVHNKETSQSTVDSRQSTKSWALTGAKGRKPNMIRSLLLNPGELEELNRVLQVTYKEIHKKEIRSESLYCDDAELIVVAYGTTSRIARASVKEFREKNKRVGIFRPITLWPFPSEALAKYAKKTKKFLVAEMSAGQMIEDVRLAVGSDVDLSFYGKMGGTIPIKEEIGEVIQKGLRSPSTSLRVPR